MRAVVTQMKPLIRVQDYVDPVDRALVSGTFVRSTQVKKSRIDALVVSIVHTFEKIRFHSFLDVLNA